MGAPHPFLAQTTQTQCALLLRKFVVAGLDQPCRNIQLESGKSTEMEIPKSKELDKRKSKPADLGGKSAVSFSISSLPTFTQLKFVMKSA